MKKITFDNRFAALGDHFFHAQAPEPLSHPHLAMLNEDMAVDLNLDVEWLKSEEGLDFLNGYKLPKGAHPLAMVYSGHQFGGYSPRLGDGRGNLIGQIRDGQNKLWDLHLKGAGLTPFSRMGDGKAVLRSTIREYLASEALSALGIPTSRALSIVGSDEPVRREKIETAALLMRVSETHIRFGHFEYFSYSQQYEDLKILCDYTLDVHFPDLKTHSNPYDAMVLEVTARTAKMVALWQAHGFAHGVMNTDNMSILGQTFDYGPYGFMEEFNPGYICNHSDNTGRYAFDQQPTIGFWNCQALAQALSSLISKDIAAQMLEIYQHSFFESYNKLMREKLGLQEHDKGDQAITAELLGLLQEYKIDYTVFYRELSSYDGDIKDIKILKSNVEYFRKWFGKYDLRLLFNVTGNEGRWALMKSKNAKYILRNYLAQTAIEKAEQGDYAELERLCRILKHPYDEQSDYEEYAKETPDWGKDLEISCSS